MAILKNKEISNMSEKERNEKIKDLKLELIKTRALGSKGKLKVSEIKKTIAKLLTFNRLNKKSIGK